MSQSEKTQQNCVVCQIATTQSCQRCLQRFYCSKECQLKHWKQTHKTECSHLSLLGTDISLSFVSHTLFHAANVELKKVTIGEGVVAKRELPAFQYIGHDPYLFKVEDKHGSEEIQATAELVKFILAKCENKPEAALAWLHEHHFTIERGKLLEGSTSLIQTLANEYHCETKAIERLWRIVYEYAMIGEPLGLTTPKELRPVYTILG
jgi:hypothetical protein